jgi:hypothetical protein
MERFAKPGDFCPNKACPDFGKLQDGQSKQNNIKSGHTKRGVQRYQCKTCGKTFTESTGTLFFRKRTPEHEILETLVLFGRRQPDQQSFASQGVQGRHHSGLVTGSSPTCRRVGSGYDERLQSQAGATRCLVGLCP